MPIVAMGLSFKSAPLELLESSTVPPEHSSEALRALVAREHISEAVVLSTCNRVEVYAGTSEGDAGIDEIRAVFLEQCRTQRTDLDRHLYVFRDHEAIRHLFRVVGGLDSMILGESEILRQVRDAFEAAVAEGTAAAALSPIFRAAFRAAKRARTETTISRAGASFPSAAVELIRRDLDRRSLKGTRAVVAGAGKIGRLSVGALLRGGVEPSNVVVLSRSKQRARQVAERWGSRHGALHDIEEELRTADAIICCTSSPEAVIDRAMVRRIVASRVASRRLAIADLAVPRDVDPSAGEETAVVVHDIDDLHELVALARERQLDQLQKVEAILDEEMERLARERRAAEVAPIISSLLANAETVREKELARIRGRLSSGDEQAIEQLTKRIVANLLHAPIEMAKQPANPNGGADFAVALRELFRLP